MPKTQMGESVRQRILNAARETGADNAALLGRYATERLLYRLCQSVHRERFVLKGAALYPLWLQDSPTAQTRPTFCSKPRSCNLAR